MNTKYIRIGCIVLSLILFLFSGWMRIKGDYRQMWKSAIGEMMSEYAYAMEQFSSYGDLASILGSDFDMDILEDVEKFIKRIEDGKLTPMEVGLMAPEVDDIIDAVNYLDGGYGYSELDDVEMVLNVYAVIFWLTFICGIAALVMAVLGKGKVFNVFYMIGEVVILIMFMLVCMAANDSAGQSILGTGFWSVLSIIAAIAALCFKSHSVAAQPAGGVPPYRMSGMNGGYTTMNPMGYQQAPMQPQGWTCPTCGALQAAESRFCATCGTSKPQPMQPQGWICPNCGASQMAESRFCAVCGNPKPQPQPVQPQAPAASFCKVCGATLLPDDQFCPECGSSTQA